MRVIIQCWGNLP